LKQLDGLHLRAGAHLYSVSPSQAELWKEWENSERKEKTEQSSIPRWRGKLVDILRCHSERSEESRVIAELKRFLDFSLRSK
jgi:hypothetical protein